MSDQKLLSLADAFVPQIMVDWHVPGLAVAVIRDNEIVLCKGYGLRSVEDNLPMSADTLLAIGSCSKAFTSTALAMLVDDGLLEWDRPLRHYMPDWRMVDPFAAERMTPRDLVCHRSGLPGHDFIWYNTSHFLSRRALYARIRYLQPAYDFRTTFHYQNLMFMAAGYLIEVVTGQTWEDFVRARLFDPLGMKTSNFSVDDMPKAREASLPYELKDGRVMRMAYAKIDNIGPAGSINSSVSEMIRWVQFQLNKGRCGDQQLISEANMTQLHTAHVPLQGELLRDYLLVERGDYGLGWFMHQHRGHRLIHHGGGIDGFSAFTSFMPEINAGMVVLTNLNLNRLSIILSYTVYDWLLGAEGTNWNETFRSARANLEAQMREADAQFNQARVPGTQPSHPLDDYTGEFENPGYGIIRITRDDSGLVQSYNDIPCPMKHYHYDTFESVFEIEMRRHRLTMNYATDAAGEIVSVAVPFEAQLPPVEFRRKDRR